MYNYYDDNIYFPFVNNRFPRDNMDDPFNIPFDVAYPPHVGIYNTMPIPKVPAYGQTPKNMNKKILDLNNEFRKLWADHVIWTKLTIMSIANESADMQLVSQRLLQNPTDFEKLLTRFYGPRVSEKFAELLRQHLLIAADLVNAAKKQDTNSVSLIESKWYKNADEIADFLNSINPYWPENAIKKMMYDHLALVKAEAVAILNNKYEDSISLFDKIMIQALIMADTYTRGIIRQFPNKF